MTIIVAHKTKNGVIMGGDTVGSKGWDTSHRKDEKIFEAHGILYGFTGSYRMGQILKYYSVDALSDKRKNDLHAYVVLSLIPMWRKILSQHNYTTIDKNVEKGGNFMIAIDGEIFSIESDFQVMHVAEDFHAIGCGEDYAKGFLYHIFDENIRLKVRRAIECAMHFSNGCGGDISILESSFNPEV